MQSHDFKCFTLIISFWWTLCVMKNHLPPFEQSSLMYNFWTWIFAPNIRLTTKHMSNICIIKILKQRKNMDAAPKSLNNEFQIQVCWKGKDFGSLSWLFDLRRKILPIVWNPGTSCVFYIIHQCQRAQTNEEYECSIKEFK